MTQREPDGAGTSINVGSPTLYDDSRPLGSPYHRDYTAADDSVKSDVGEPPPAEELRRLLIGYGVALDAAWLPPAM